MFDNKGMEEMIKVLEQIGIPAEQCAKVRDYFEGDTDGLKSYVLYCVALFDDRHEYLA